jgi:hypothetical protein
MLKKRNYYNKRKDSFDKIQNEKLQEFSWSLIEFSHVNKKIFQIKNRMIESIIQDCFNAIFVIR